MHGVELYTGLIKKYGPEQVIKGGCWWNDLLPLYSSKAAQLPHGTAAAAAALPVCCKLSLIVHGSACPQASSRQAGGGAGHKGMLCCCLGSNLAHLLAVHRAHASLVLTRTSQRIRQLVMCTLAASDVTVCTDKGKASCWQTSIMQGLSSAYRLAGKVGSDGKVVCGCALCNFGVSQCVSEFEKHGRSGANRPAQNVCLAALSEEADHEISLGVSALRPSAAACMAL